MMKKPVLMSIMAGTGILVAVGLVVFSDGLTENKTPRIAVSEARLIYDPSDIRQVAGTFSDIFTGRVVEELGTENPDGIVQTLYSVEVFSALKGTLQGRVIVSQPGGLWDSTWHVFASDHGRAEEALESDLLDEYFLQPGKTYLFATLPDERHGRHVVSTESSGRVLLAIEDSVSEEDAREMSASDPSVIEMSAAIKNQIAPTIGSGE